MTKEEFEILVARAMNSFDDKDYFSLMEEALERVDPKFDKRPGSMVWNGNAPSLAELAQLYTALDFVFNATYIRTAPREYLIKRAADRSLSPTPATRAIYNVLFSTDDGKAIPRGTRFSAEELNFEVITHPKTDDSGKTIENPEDGDLRDGNNMQLIRCETPGTVGNSSSNQKLIPIDYVAGLGATVVGDIHTVAEDEEETEVFRERVLEAMRSIAFGGNQADYREKVLAIDGVGQCKVYPVWNSDVPPSVLVGDPEVIDDAKDTVDGLLDGDVKTYLTALLNAAGDGKLTVGGTVRVVVASTDTGDPEISESKVEEIQDTLDPRDSAGEGKGLAPIGHVVTVASAAADELDVAMTYTTAEGVQESEANAIIEEALTDYFASVAKTWQKNDQLQISRAVIVYMVLQAAEGKIKNIVTESVMIAGDNNNRTMTAADYMLDKDALPVLGLVNP